MTSRRGPPSSSAVSCPVFSSMPACRARTAPALVGSITKHTVSGPMIIPGTRPALISVFNDRDVHCLSSLLRSYLRGFSSDKEQGIGLLPGGAACVRGADMDGGRLVVCHRRPGRGVAGGAPLPVVAEHGPRLRDVAGAVVVVPGAAR